MIEIADSPPEPGSQKTAKGRKPNMIKLKGICVPICTPFENGGASLDIRALEGHIESMIEAGVHIIAVNGGTGEFPFLTDAEKRQIAEVAARRIDGRAKLIVQTSALRTEDAMANAKHAAGVGADALLILPPFFEGPGESGVRWHYEQIARAVSTPIMVYNIPQFSGFDITPEVYRRLSEIENVQYIKDSTSNMLRIEQLAAQGSAVFNGCDYLNLYSLIAGAAGCFTGAGNAIPAQLVKLYDLFTSDRLSEAASLWRELKPLNTLLWTAPFNPVAKAAAVLSGRPVGECRRPVLPLAPSEMALVREAMAKVSQ
jgi:4-hydroxy-tetrahydrodipicolinate synthase